MWKHLIYCYISQWRFYIADIRCFLYTTYSNLLSLYSIQYHWQRTFVFLIYYGTYHIVSRKDSYELIICTRASKWGYRFQGFYKAAHVACNPTIIYCFYYCLFRPCEYRLCRFDHEGEFTMVNARSIWYGRRYFLYWLCFIWSAGFTVSIKIQCYALGGAYYV